MSAKVATHPRVSLADLEANIKEQYFFLLRDALNSEMSILGAAPPSRLSEDHPTATLTICVLVLQNGFTVIGKASPASPENFNREIGRKFALEDAKRQLWPLMGYALKDKLAGR